MMTAVQYERLNINRLVRNSQHSRAMSLAHQVFAEYGKMNFANALSVAEGNVWEYDPCRLAAMIVQVSNIVKAD